MGQMKMKDKNIFFKIVKKSILFGGIAAAGTFPVHRRESQYAAAQVMEARQKYSMIPRETV